MGVDGMTERSHPMSDPDWPTISDPLQLSSSGLPHTIDGQPYQEPVDDTDPTGRVVGYVVLVFIAVLAIGGPIVLAWLLGVKL
jgi:hypothetical protein